MKPDFALDFRENQIALLHRHQMGWKVIGRVAMDDPDLDAALAYMRATALGLSPRGISTKLILPNDAILYTSLSDLPLDPAKRAAQIAADLTGRTPYAVEDLAWDWADHGASADLAVIARETLAEAEAFAESRRFNPISFAAIPNSGDFDSQFWFGPSKLSQKLLASGEVVERDDAFISAHPATQAPETVLAAGDFELGENAKAAPLDAGPVPSDPTPNGAETAADPVAAPQPEVWQDFIDARDANALAQDLTTAMDAPPVQDGDAAPESFDVAMAELAAQDNVAADVDPSQDKPALTTQSEDAAPEDVAAGAKPSSAENFGEPTTTKAEELLAAFAARRAAALAKAEAQTNGARAEPPLTLGVKPSAENLAGAESARDTAVLGGAQPATRLRPAEVKHVPAKDLPHRPQNLKAMPRPKQAKSGVMLAWVLTAVLLIALVAAGALSSYVLETVNRLFFTNTAVASAPEDTIPAPSQKPQADNAPPISPPAAHIAVATRGVPLPSLPKAAPKIDVARPAASGLVEVPKAAAAPPPSDVAALTQGLSPSPRPQVFADPALAGQRPVPRPATLAGAQTDAIVGADPALAGARPMARPQAILAAGRAARLASAPASLVASAEIDADENALLGPSGAPIGQAGPLSLSVSLIPAARPSGLAAAFEAARDAEIIALAAANAAATPEETPESGEVSSDPEQVEANDSEDLASLEGEAGTRSIVEKQATVRNAIDLRDVNLIGIFGTNANRYALIRQSTGAYRKLKVGDRFDGGQVAAITDSEVRYAKGSQMLALQMPRS